MRRIDVIIKTRHTKYEIVCDDTHVDGVWTVLHLYGYGTDSNVKHAAVQDLDDVIREILDFVPFQDHDTFRIAVQRLSPYSTKVTDGFVEVERIQLSDQSSLFRVFNGVETRYTPYPIRDSDVVDRFLRPLLKDII